jgi:RNA polymerase sigma-70 factor (ECF subfamily)
MTLLEQVITRLREESAAEGKGKMFEQLKPFLMTGQTAIPYAEAAAGLGLNEGAARVAVHRLRKRYRELLREEISQTLSDPADAAEEMRALFRAFAD